MEIDIIGENKGFSTFNALEKKGPQTRFFGIS